MFLIIQAELKFSPDTPLEKFNTYIFYIILYSYLLKQYSFYVYIFAKRLHHTFQNGRDPSACFDLYDLILFNSSLICYRYINYKICRKKINSWILRRIRKRQNYATTFKWMPTEDLFSVCSFSPEFWNILPLKPKKSSELCYISVFFILFWDSSRRGFSKDPFLKFMYDTLKRILWGICMYFVCIVRYYYVDPLCLCYMIS